MSSGTRFIARNPPEGGFATYVSRSITSSPYTFQAKIVLHLPVEKAAEVITPSIGVLEAAGKRKCILHTGAHSLYALSIHLALLDAQFEVQEPPELIEHVRKLADRLNRAT